MVGKALGLAAADKELRLVRLSERGDRQERGGGET